MDLATIGGGFNSFIEGAAALFVIYWLMASSCSFATEMLSSIANIRGNALRQFAVDMVQGELQKKDGIFSWIRRRCSAEGDDGVFTNILSKRINLGSSWISGFAVSLFSHNLMKSLEQPKLLRSGENSPPAYVPSAIFAQTVVDRLLNIGSFRHFIDLVPLPDPRNDPAMKAGVRELRRQLVVAGDAMEKAIASISLPQGANAWDLLISALQKVLESPVGADVIKAYNAVMPNPIVSVPVSAPTLANALFANFQPALTALPARLPPTVANVVEALKRDDVPAALKQTLQPLVDAAQHDVAALTNNIAVWYDASMARATGWYKRYTLVLLGCFGFLLAVAFNVDSPRIITALINTPALRTAGYAAAVHVVDSKSDASRQSMPQQLAFVRAVDQLRAVDKLCDSPPSETPDCVKIDDRIPSLLPLTLSAGSNANILIPISLYKQSNSGGVKIDQNSLKAFFIDFCKNTTKCSQSLKDELNKPDSNVINSVANDSSLFWSPGILECYAGSPPADCQKSIDRSYKAAKLAVGALSAYSDAIPGIGWMPSVWSAENWSPLSFDMLARVIGWFLTGLMVSLGAPFWFDLLQQLVNRRGAGPKPDEAVAKPVGQ